MKLPSRQAVPWQAYVYVGLAVVGWSTVGTAFKLALRTLDTTQLLAYSTLSSTLVLGGVALGQGKLNRIRRQTAAQVRLSALQGLLNPCAYYLLLFMAYDRLPAQAALALNYTWPLVLALLAVPLLNEPLRRRTLIALGVCLLGVVCIATRGDWQTLNVQDPVGIVLALMSAGLWALYWLTNVKDPRDAVVKLFTGFGFGSVYTLMLLPVLSTPRGLTWLELLWVGYIGTVEMGVTFLFWLRGLELAPNRGSMANWVYLAPFLSLLLIGSILGEPIAPASVVGLFLIVGAILWQSQPASPASTGEPVQPNNPSTDGRAI